MSAHPRLSLNQATIKYADLATALRVTREAGIASIGLWREPVAEVGLAAAKTPAVILAVRLIRPAVEATAAALEAES